MEYFIGYTITSIVEAIVNNAELIGLWIAAGSASVSAIALVLNYTEMQRANRLRATEKVDHIIDLIGDGNSFTNLGFVEGFFKGKVQTGNPAPSTPEFKKMQEIATQAQSITTQFKSVFEEAQTTTDPSRLQSLSSQIKVLKLEAESCYQKFQDFEKSLKRN